jgi:protein TonB
MSVAEEMKAEPRLNTGNVFGACLVDGNPEQIAREKKIKRRALILSVALQGAGLAVLVVAPMLAKPAELVMRTVPPMPLYSHRPAPIHTISDPGPRHSTQPCFSCAANKPVPTNVKPTPIDETPTGFDERIIPGIATADGIPIADSHNQPKRPDPVVEVQKVLHMTHIDPAMLTHRVEPVYPPLAKATRRSGKVELHALIAADGTVQSLQVVSGNPLLVRSTLDAVREWRYKPTYLNGQAVEVDTYITVIYSLQQ